MIDFSPTKLRHPRPRRLHLAFWMLALIVALTSPVLALDDADAPHQAQITAPATLPDKWDDRIALAESAVEGIMSSAGLGELRLRPKRQNDDKEDKTVDKSEDKTNVKDKGEKKTTVDKEENTKTKNTDQTKTKDGDYEEEDDVSPTKVISEDLDSITTFTVSLDPSSVATSTAVEESPLPVAFDGTLGSEFKSEGSDDSCPTFMSALLNSQTFKDCYPLSMMIQTSTSFFNARKQLTSTVKVLDAACAADVESCSSFFTTAAKNLTSEANCKNEFDNRLTIILEAYKGLMSYKMLFAASCLQEPSTNMYCFANAVTNLSTPSDAYMYFLPYGLSLPGSSTPSCSWCNQETMAVYHAASADRDQLISTTYEDAAFQINTLCGPNYVNGTLPEPDLSMGFAALPSWLTLSATVLFGAAINSLL